jgi:hypothetical protein
MSIHCEVLTSQVTGTSQSMNDYVIAGHDQRLAPDHLAIITESGEMNSICYIWRVTTPAAEPAVTPFCLGRIGVGPYAFDHTCHAPHAAAIAINTGGRAIGR